MKTSVKISQFTWDFKKALLYKQSTFITNNFFCLRQILFGLYRDGIISGYKNLNKTEKIEIFLKQEPKGGNVVNKIVNGSTPSLMAIARLTELNTEKKNHPTSLSIIRTAKYGLITSDTALKKKVGGIHLGKII